MKDQIRAIVLECLAGGAPVPRGVLLRAVAGQVGVEAAKRQLRARVAGVLREMEREGLIVDGGPEVWMAPSTAPEDG
ncbi:MAG: hypothetical protein Q9Q40_05645 [Acidobacteriota bacterium]|nr:hypothetical protein [Acidobacteriota bacterium]